MPDDPIVRELRTLPTQPDEPAAADELVGRAATEGRRRVRRNRAWTGAGAAVVVALGVGIAATLGGVGRPAPVVTAVPAAPSTGVPTSMPDSPTASPGEARGWSLAGLRGQVRWWLDERGVWVSSPAENGVPVATPSSGGAPVSVAVEYALPPGVARADIRALDVSPTGQLRLVTADESGALGVSTAISGWTRVNLDTGWTQSPTVIKLFADDRGGVTVAAQRVTDTGCDQRVFASRDSGRTFQRVDSAADCLAWLPLGPADEAAVAFGSPAQGSVDRPQPTNPEDGAGVGVAIAANHPTSAVPVPPLSVRFTTDGGRTWSESILDRPLPTNARVGAPDVVRNSVSFPAVLSDGTLALLRSDDGGAHFRTTPIGPAAGSAAPVAGHSGSTWWVSDGTTIFRSVDDGTTTLNATAPAPAGLVQFGVTDGKAATALIRWAHSCPAGAPRTSCSSLTFQTTQDIGMHWSNLP